MVDQPFRFKEFSIHQDRCAMKIGTDGVLLGAWVNLPQSGKALDIGTGTGLIALMLAQRSSLSVDAIEIDKAAATQASENFAASPWAERLTLHHSSLQDYRSPQPFDLIISNPPYFESTKGIVDGSRTLARSTASLPLQDLITIAADLLTPNGSLALVLPSDDEERLLSMAKAQSLHPNRLCRVKGNIESKTKRILVQLSRTEIEYKPTELIVETSRHVYSNEYRTLTKDFYLSM